MNNEEHQEKGKITKLDSSSNKKTSFSPKQVEFLRACVEVNSYPSLKERMELGAKLGQEVNSIGYWFNNERRKREKLGLKNIKVEEGMVSFNDILMDEEEEEEEEDVSLISSRAKSLDSEDSLFNENSTLPNSTASFNGRSFDVNEEEDNVTFGSSSTNSMNGSLNSSLNISLNSSSNSSLNFSLNSSKSGNMSSEVTDTDSGLSQSNSSWSENETSYRILDDSIMQTDDSIGQTDESIVHADDSTSESDERLLRTDDDSYGQSESSCSQSEETTMQSDDTFESTGSNLESDDSLSQVVDSILETEASISSIGEPRTGESFNQTDSSFSQSESSNISMVDTSLETSAENLTANTFTIPSDMSSREMSDITETTNSSLSQSELITTDAEEWTLPEGWTRFMANGLKSPSGVQYKSIREAIQAVVNKEGETSLVEELRGIYVAKGWTSLGKGWLGKNGHKSYDFLAPDGTTFSNKTKAAAYALEHYSKEEEELVKTFTPPTQVVKTEPKSQPTKLPLGLNDLPGLNVKVIQARSPEAQRHRFSQTIKGPQLEALTRVYKAQSYPTQLQREELASRLGMPVNVVRNFLALFSFSYYLFSFTIFYFL